LSRIQGSGFNQNLSVASCNMGSTSLNELYTNLATVGASGAAAKTITVTGNWGATASTKSIAIGKGWAVTG
jgi:hypothetical protein